MSCKYSNVTSTIIRYPIGSYRLLSFLANNVATTSFIFRSSWTKHGGQYIVAIAVRGYSTTKWSFSNYLKSCVAIKFFQINLMFPCHLLARVKNSAIIFAVVSTNVIFLPLYLSSHTPMCLFMSLSHFNTRPYLELIERNKIKSIQDWRFNHMGPNDFNCVYSCNTSDVFCCSLSTTRINCFLCKSTDLYCTYSQWLCASSSGSSSVAWTIDTVFSFLLCHFLMMLVIIRLC